MLEDDNTASETYELYGPTNYSMEQIAELVDREIYKKRRHINVPKRLLKPAAQALNQLLWWKITSADEVEREYLDQVIDRKAKTFADLNIVPADLKNFTFHYLVSVMDGLTPHYFHRLIPMCSKGTVVRNSTTCLQQPRERRGRRESTCMS